MGSPVRAEDTDAVPGRGASPDFALPRIVGLNFRVFLGRLQASHRRVRFPWTRRCCYEK